MVGAFGFFLKLGFDFVLNELFRMVHWVNVDEEPQLHDISDGPWMIHHASFIHG